MTNSRPSVSEQSAGEALRSLAVAALLSIDAFRVELQRCCARAVELRPVVTHSGAPPGLWLRTADADYLYYESQTSPFHQANILLLLTARLLVNDRSGTTFDPRLVPDLSPEMVRLILGDDTQIAEAEDEAERLVYQAIEHAHRRLPGPTAMRLLRQLRPLHAALLDAVPEAARAEVPGRPGPRVRLHQAVVEIREAVLALRPYVEPQLATAACKMAHSDGASWRRGSRCRGGIRPGSRRAGQGERRARAGHGRGSGMAARARPGPAQRGRLAGPGGADIRPRFPDGQGRAQCTHGSHVTFVPNLRRLVCRPA